MALGEGSVCQMPSKLLTAEIYLCPKLICGCQWASFHWYHAYLTASCKNSCLQMSWKSDV